MLGTGTARWLMAFFRLVDAGATTGLPDGTDLAQRSGGAHRSSHTHRVTDLDEPLRITFSAPSLSGWESEGQYHTLQHEEGNGGGDLDGGEGDEEDSLRVLVFVPVHNAPKRRRRRQVVV